MMLYFFYLGFAAYSAFSTIILTWLAAPDNVTNGAVNTIFLVGAAGFIISQLGHLYTLFYYLRRSLIVLCWYASISVHWWAVIAWTLLIGSTVDTGMDPRYLVQLAMAANGILLLGLMIYNYKNEQSRRIEAQQRSVESLRIAHDLERSKSNFVAVVGHDLRGPVQAISHFTQALKRGWSETSLTILHKIDENITMISTLLDHMVKISKVEWQSTKPMLETVALRPLLFELRYEFGDKAQEKGLLLEFDVPSCFVESDWICLGQVLRNLIDNAIKYTEKGYVRVTVKEHLDSISVVVEDSGRGIPASELGNIFDEFYRGAEIVSSTTGVGLGLSIVSRLTKSLGIEVTVSSRRQEGSKFELNIPKSKESE